MYDDFGKLISRAVVFLLAIAIIVSLTVGGLVGYVIR